jgi:hypothetical protein
MMKIAEIRITEAVWLEDRVPIARLMREYVEALEADISFQDFESEYAVRLMHERPVRLNVVYKTGTRI